MNDERKRILIAEACGWKYSDEMRRKNPLLAWMRPDGGFSDRCPDYLSDLNAMHEAENTLSKDQQIKFVHRLEIIVAKEPNANLWSWALLHATARQLADAFLVTIGKLKSTS